MATKRAKATKASDQSVITIDLTHYVVPITIIIAGIFIALSVVVSSKVISGEKILKAVEKAGIVDNGNTATVTNIPTKDVSMSIDDDPILGNRDAKVAIIEFSDYECPYCQQYFSQTYPQIVDNFIDKGDVMYVLRDYPLTSIHPNSMRYALASNCYKEQTNDDGFFKIHDELFKKTTAVVTDDELTKIAEDAGLSTATFRQCLESEKYKDEVNHDVSEGSSIGINATPSFVIGTIDSSGNVNGKLLVGAQSYAVFESIINSALAK
jgi:protein-disulfide isomerase